MGWHSVLHAPTQATCASHPWSCLRRLGISQQGLTPPGQFEALYYCRSQRDCASMSSPLQCCIPCVLMTHSQNRISFRAEGDSNSIWLCAAGIRIWAHQHHHGCITGDEASSLGESTGGCIFGPASARGCQPGTVTASCIASSSSTSHKHQQVVFVGLAQWGLNLSNAQEVIEIARDGNRSPWDTR